MNYIMEVMRLAKRNNDIKVIIVNPEALPKAQEKFTKAVYTAYLESLKEEKIK